MLYRDCTPDCQDNVLISATEIGTEHDYTCPHFVLNARPPRYCKSPPKKDENAR